MPYIGRIEVRNHYKLRDFEIPFEAPGGSPFRHLILTGPNGSGKTTILAKLVHSITQDLNGNANHRHESLVAQLKAAESMRARFPGNQVNPFESQVKISQQLLNSFRVDEYWYPSQPGPGNPIGVYLSAHRPLQVDKARGVEKVDAGRVSPEQSLARNFLKHLVNLEVQSRLAKDEDPPAAAAITAWLSLLEQALAELFEIPGLRMEFVRKNYDIRFVEPTGAQYDFNQLAAGHASVLNILAEILLRVPDGALTTDNGAFASPAGIVIIDEIETHLHPSLQERLLPFLVRAFPNMQFIVATHSPAIICSIDNALVWDLRSMQGVLSDELRGTPYGDLMKIQFGIESDIDLESTKQLKRLKELRDNGFRSDSEQAEFEHLASKLRKTSQVLALEVWAQLEQERLADAGE